MMTAHSGTIQGFLTTWEASGASELGNARSFVNELCHQLEVCALSPPNNAKTNSALLEGKRTAQRLAETECPQETRAQALKITGRWIT